MKNRQAILLLFGANSISGFAQGISMIAIPWYIANIAGKQVLLGQIYVGVTIVSLFWGLYAGSLIDRHNRKRIMQSYSVIGAILLFSVAITGIVHQTVPLPLVALVYASTFFIYNIHYPNLYAFIQEITEPENYSRITSYLEIQGQFTTAMAGEAASILLTGIHHPEIRLGGWTCVLPIEFKAWGLDEVFMLDAATYVISLILITSMRFTPIARRYRDYNGVMTRIKKGLQFLIKQPLIFLFGVASFSIFVTILVLSFYLMPIYVNNHLHQEAKVYAMFEMVFACGSILAGLMIRRLFARSSTVFAIIVLTFTASCIYFIAVFNDNLPVFYISFFLLGLTNAGTRIMRVTYLFHHIPNDYIGRVGSVFNVFSVLFRLILIAIFTLPFFTTGNHVIYAMLILGLFCFAGGMLLTLNYHRLKD